MNIYVTGRSTQVTDEMKNYLQEKIGRVEKYSLKECDIHATLDVQKYRYIAEINVKSPFSNIHCKEEEADMFAAIDNVIDKIERQMRRTKERVQNHKKTINDVPADMTAGSEEILVEDFHLSTISLSEAIKKLENDHEHFFVFKNPETRKVDFIHKIKDNEYELYELSNSAVSSKDHVTLLSKVINTRQNSISGVTVEIVEREDLQVDILSVAHASKKLQSVGLEFLVFSEQDSGKVGVIFYREDGRIGLIKPQF
ncbi:MAG: ribosome-associated translation inhibitor RaiA [bacterium]|nr:ribosome-associated translation inhibitor RaiA [bacterium]